MLSELLRQPTDFETARRHLTNQLSLLIVNCLYEGYHAFVILRKKIVIALRKFLRWTFQLLADILQIGGNSTKSVLESNDSLRAVYLPRLLMDYTSWTLQE